MRLLTLIALPLVAGPVLAQRVPCPGDFTAAYKDGAKAHAACSPRVAFRLVNSQRAGLLARIPNNGASRFVTMVAEHGDPVASYVLDNLPELQDGAWDAFVQEPQLYVGTGRPLEKAKLTEKPEKPEFTFGPMVEPNGKFGVVPGFEPRKGPLEKEVAGFPVWVIGCGVVFLLCVLRRKKQQEGAA